MIDDAMRPILELSQQLALARSGHREMVDAFVSSYSFPLVDPGTAVFFLRLGGVREAYLVHWVFGLEGRQPLVRLVDTDALYLPVELPATARVEYKFEIVDHDGQHSWIHDPLNPRRAFDPFGSNSVCAMPGYQPPRWAAPDPLSRPGTLTHLTHHSAIYGEERRTEIYLPSEHKPGKRYPIVLCHDGHDYLRFTGIQQILDNLIARHEVAPLIMAFTSGGARNREYGADPRQADFLVHELLPLIGERFGISDDPADRGLMGASFGAVSSLACAWRHPGVFGRLLLQSGSFVFTDIGHHGRSELFDPVVAFVNELRADPGRIEAQRVFLSCGTFESLIWFNRSLAPLLRQAGIETRLQEVSDGHNWIAWRDQLRDGLAWLFP
ncbi:MAG TPA: enterochelin esterase, partial [Deltaproteobacteria bacterium]|nr:enterochelin esterase [Deltaproteobacteria bacterium]